MAQPKYSLNTPSASIGLLAFFSLGLLVALGWAYRCGAPASDFKVILGGAFSSFSGALLLALRGGANTDAHVAPEPPVAMVQGLSQVAPVQVQEPQKPAV